MSLFRKFPYTNFHDINLDWIMKQIKAIAEKTKNIVTSVNGATGDVYLDVPRAYNGLPKAPGTASPGSSALYARGDHVHPASTAQEVFWATPNVTPMADIEAAYTANKIVLCNDNGNIYLLVKKGNTGLRFSMAQNGTIYNYDITNDLWAASQYTIPSAGYATPQPLGTATAGTSTGFSRADHVHAMPSAGDVGAIPSPTGAYTIGDVVTWDGNNWIASALPLYNGGVG